MQDHPAFVVHGPPQTVSSLVLDSPHSGSQMPADFGSHLSVQQLREGEDCFVDELWQPAAAAAGVPLLAARFARTYIDANRHEADIDPELLAAPWPGELRPSGKAAIGKALLWRTLDDGTPLYRQPLAVAAVQARIERWHRPYHQRLRALLDAAHARFGAVHHINCHSMNAVAGAMGEGGAGATRADIVLGDRDGTSCTPAFTHAVRDFLAARGLDVRINDPFKGVELVRAYSDPAAGRHSLQLEINKRLYMHGNTGDRHAGFATLQATLTALLAALRAQFTPGGAR